MGGKQITGLDFLVREQQANGSFLSYSSPRKRDFVEEKTYQSTFTAALILSCLSSLPDEKPVGEVKDKVARFLLAQKSEHWSFNYWVRNAKDAKAKPYPDDLDDTFCALAALTLHDKDIIDGAAMAKIVTLLTAVEEKEGGPYRTWLVPGGSGETWRDVDVAVNSNIAYFLSLHEVDLPNVTELVESAIAEEDYNSRYYPLPYPIIYFISRWYRGNLVPDVRKWLLGKRHTAGSWGNPLSTALAVSSLLNFGTMPDDVVKQALGYLVKSQSKDGSWPAAAFCLDPAIEKKPYYAGSAALTTAFGLEALAKYDGARKPKNRIVKSSRVARAARKQQQLHGAIVDSARTRFKKLDVELRKQALVMLEKTIKGDKDEQIVLLPYYFRASLGERSKIVSDELVLRLGLANLYGWIAYTIYDDFLDREGDPKLLSVANVCLREAAAIFDRVLPVESGFASFARHVLDTIDAANTWEITHCRDSESIPDYGDLTQLAGKSLGHALGPVAILFSMGITKESPEVKNVMSFFKHYIIARQINDDAHDWEADLKRGHINAVGAMLLKAAEQKKVIVGDLESALPKLQALFWHEVVEEVCNRVLEQVQLARESFRAISIGTDESLLEKLLTSVEQSAQKALREREETLKFLKAYQA